MQTAPVGDRKNGETTGQTLGKGKRKRSTFGAVSNSKTFQQAQAQTQFPLRPAELSTKRKVLRWALCPCLFPFHQAKRCGPRRAWSRLLAGCLGLSPQPAVSSEQSTSPWQHARTAREQSAPGPGSFFAFCVFPSEDSSISGQGVQAPFCFQILLAGGGERKKKKVKEKLRWESFYRYLSFYN